MAAMSNYADICTEEDLMDDAPRTAASKSIQHLRCQVFLDGSMPKLNPINR